MLETGGPQEPHDAGWGALAITGPRRARGPREEDVDYYGMTHAGRVRKANQDHFLIGSLHKVMKLHATSFPDPHRQRFTSDPFAGIVMVADGVGGLQGGERASGTALDALTRYLTYTLETFRHTDPAREAEFLAQLNESVLRCHRRILELASRDPEHRGMATTLTLVYVVWPPAYVIHVGDSRCYQLRGGELLHLTRDQTLAEDLVDQGVLLPEEAKVSQLSHVLSSAIGGPAANPVTTRTDLGWDDVLLLCTDGLTKHVSDDEIRAELLATTTAREACHNLVSLALDRGGTDNVTVVVVRIKPESRPGKS